MARSHAICSSSVLLLALFLTCANAATFDINNNCPYPVWAAALPGGGQLLDRGQSWSLNVSPGTRQARIWARTNCQFDAAGEGKCQTGDCGGVRECTSYGQPPNTLAEYALNQFDNKDFFDISLVEGFNVPMSFSPTSKGCNRGIECSADIIGQCPAQLNAPGGCNNPCPVFKTDEYCCNSGNCGPTDFSMFFKDRCPDAYSYPKDDQTSAFTCPGGTNYRVVFCPHRSTFKVVNQCAYTVWAAATPGGGRRLDPGDKWVLSVGTGTTTGRIWGRTNCSFDANGQGQCETGDCDLLLDCSSSGSPPSTVAEFNFSQNGWDILDISLVNGFNIPMQLRPTTGACRGIKCSDDINSQCPAELKAPGGCKDPCTVFRTTEYCCNNPSKSCGSTAFSQFFKDRCPDAYSYPRDDPATFTCPVGTNYIVTFCP